MSAPESPNAGRRRGFELLIEVPAVAVTFLMMLHVTINALLRTFADAPISHTVEIGQYWYLPIIAFLGFIAAQHRGQHVAADLVFERLPAAAKPYVLAGLMAVCAVLAAGFCWFGLGEALHAFDIRKTAGISSLTAWPAYFVAPLAFGALTVQFVIAAVRAARGRGADAGADAEARAEGSLS
ncbi:hypothetical protein GCM10010191_77910 [Actinomadura vinacea]|uniref:Tripartite ATP-independent periplasmic transporters DctQ component domain-containing protein n=1 Tax=Actinomadura vinacea TaxID=115336 RepID=A0ABP5XFN6_9ACTN